MMQYRHCRQGEFFSELDATVAIIAPTREDLERVFLSHSTQTLMQIGVTVKCPKDQFVKRDGRGAAVQNMIVQLVEFKGVVQSKLKHVYQFSADILHNKRAYELDICISTIAESSNVRLLDACIRRKEVVTE